MMMIFKYLHDTVYAKDGEETLPADVEVASEWVKSGQNITKVYRRENNKMQMKPFCFIPWYVMKCINSMVKYVLKK